MHTYNGIDGRRQPADREDEYGAQDEKLLVFSIEREPQYMVRVTNTYVHADFARVLEIYVNSPGLKKPETI